MQLAEHFFRHESGRLVAALTRLFGVYNLALAEDVAQHALCRALEVWPSRGVPENPTAWLLTTAKHRALDVMRRERTARAFAPELARLLDREAELVTAIDEAFSPGAIRDEQLRMMLSCCAKALPPVAQVCLILNVLCGFGASEIGSALLTGQAAVEKRIARGRRTLARQRCLFELSDVDLRARLATVRQALYLLFNEGYHGASATSAVRPELCQEAIRLTSLLCEHPTSASPTTQALLSLMCLNAARLPARLSADGQLLPWSEQDRAAWDHRLVEEGLRRFELSAAGDEVSAFHLEAAIAVAHASSPSHAATDWHRIVGLYDRLLARSPSPVVALARSVALAERDGPGPALAALRGISHAERLSAYPFYEAALAELYLRLGDLDAAASHFRRALARARSELERAYLQKRLGLTHH